MSQAPEATAYTAPRRASVPLAQKFSTRVTGMKGRRRVTERGMADFPTCTSSLAVESHAAWMAFFSMPASVMHSSNASTIRSSASASHRSPNLEQPIPMMATLSLIPSPMSLPPYPA